MSQVKVDMFSDYYTEEVTNYLKIMAYKIENIKMLLDDDYTDSYESENILNYVSPLKESSLDSLKDIIVNNDNDKYLNVIMLSNELSRLIIDDHVILIRDEEGNKLIYEMDDFAVNRLNNKFNLGLKGNLFSLESSGDDFKEITLN